MIAGAATLALASLGVTAFLIVSDGSEPSVEPTKPSPTAASPAVCRGVQVRSGDDLAAVTSAHAPGTTYCLEPGIHRLRRAIVPKPGDAFVGPRSAIVRGALTLGPFVREGSAWVAQGEAAESPAPVGECERGRACSFPSHVFLGDRALRRVSQLPIDAGEAFIDARSRVHLADDPGLSAVEQSVAAGAFLGNPDAPASNVRISGMTVERFANPAQQGAIDSLGGEGWIVEDTEIRDNHGIGVCGDSRAVVRRNSVHHQGQLGVCGHGSGGVYEDNEIAFNNTAGFDWHWEAGGTKFVKTDGLIVRRNYSHDNVGPGLWTDIDNDRTLYEDNRVENNVGPGIFHEISYSAVIRGNTITGNGRGVEDGLDGAGILISGSANVEITGNDVRRNGDGIGLKQTDRRPGPRGPYELADVVVSENRITMDVGRTGLLQTVGDRTYFTSRNIRFESNQYLVGPNPEYFEWDDAGRTWQQWRTFGHDAGGSLGRIPVGG